MTASNPLALLTDFGNRDAYVGIMKGVITSICPDTTLIDLTHEIPPQDLQAAAFTLMTALPYFPDGSHFLVVVDPGVGTERDAICVQTNRHIFVAPDNGVLTYALAKQDIQQAWAAPPAGDTAASHTFHGRDIFAPAVAHSLNHPGTPPPGFHPTTASALVTYRPLSIIYHEPGVIGEVIYIDRFGNAITSIGMLAWQPGSQHLQLRPGDGLPDRTLPASVKIHVADITLDGIHKTYGQASKHQALALVGSSGYLEVAVNQGNAAKRLNLKRGDKITVEITESN